MDSPQRLRLLVQRTWQLAAVLGVAFLLVVIGYWYTQVVRGDYYRELAENNRLRELKLEAPRGVILDREGRPLVEKRAELLPAVRSWAQPQRRIEHLVPGAHARSPRARARAAGRRRRRQRLVRPAGDGGGPHARSGGELEAAALEHPEFEIEVRQRRFYRHGEQTAHVVGYLSEANERALSRRPDLHLGDMVGVKGRRADLRLVLRGADGRRVVVVDSRGKFVHEEMREPSRPGGNLETTLDLELQQEAERFFADKVGSAVALDPSNGDILAMVSAPSFNPNVFARHIDLAGWRSIVDAPHQPLQNRALQNTYPPGSVFKIVTAIAALEQGMVDPHRVGGVLGRHPRLQPPVPVLEEEGHGRVDLRRAIVQSCDVYFYHLGARLSIDPIAAWARKLGLGSITGVDLMGEKAGIVPDKQWSLRERGTMWFPGETVSVAIGQGPLLVTSAPGRGDDGDHRQRRPRGASAPRARHHAARHARGRPQARDARVHQGRADGGGQRGRHRRSRPHAPTSWSPARPGPRR
jgi:penicillin-binding protein 2